MMNIQREKKMAEAYFLALKQSDGSPGQPLANEDNAIMVWDDLAQATKIRDQMLSEKELGVKLSIFKAEMTIVGEVLA